MWGEQKRVLMDLDVMTTQHCPFIVQYYGLIIKEVGVGVCGSVQCEQCGGVLI